MSQLYIAQDAALRSTLGACPQLATLGITFEPATPYGVAVWKRCQVVGLWSFFHCRYRYRSLASWASIFDVATCEEAIPLTLTMANLNAWSGISIRPQNTKRHGT